MSSHVFNGDSLMQWQEITTEELRSTVKESSNASYEVVRMPTRLIKTCLLDTLLPVITKIINMSLNLGSFPDCYKCAHVKPLLKKITLDPDILKSHQPVSNLTFISKLMEKSFLNNLSLICKTITYWKSFNVRTKLFIVQRLH